MFYGLRLQSSARSLPLVALVLLPFSAALAGPVWLLAGGHGIPMSAPGTAEAINDFAQSIAALTRAELDSMG